MITEPKLLHLAKMNADLLRALRLVTNGLDEILLLVPEGRVKGKGRELVRASRDVIAFVEEDPA